MLHDLHSQLDVLMYSPVKHSFAHNEHLFCVHKTQSSPKAKQSCSNSVSICPLAPEPTVMLCDLSFLVIAGVIAPTMQEIIIRVTISSTKEKP